jgi:alkyldihydroxyacetonephosphate synthase
VTHSSDHLDHLVRRGWTPAGGQDAILPPHATRWLASRTGLDAVSTPAAPDAALVVQDSALPEDARRALSSVVGERHVLTDRDARIGRTGGLSYVDLLRHRGVGELTAPDAVVVPADPVIQSRTIFLLLQPYAFSIRPSTSDVALEDLLTELGRLLDVALRPA